jgi:hypothetical protein
MPRLTTTVERRTVTPPELARAWGVAPEKIVALIRAGELKAFNAALHRNGARPRYLINVEDVTAFEQARSAAARPSRAASRQRRRKNPDVIEFIQ